MVIWKFPIPIEDEFSLQIPAKATVLTVQVQKGTPCVWVLMNELDAKANMVGRQFRLYGTGNPVDDDPGRYIGTFQVHGGELVFHLFELTGESLHGKH